MRPFLVAAGLVCTAVLAPVAAQNSLSSSAARGDLWLGGSVVDSVTGEPVRFALVSLSQKSSYAGASLSKNMLADASGRFRFAELPAGEFRLNASKPTYDWSERSETTVNLERSRDDAVVRLTPYARLRGKVVDAAAEPLSGVTVQVFRSTVRDGRRITQLQTWASTDDRGEYRMSHLPGGGIYAVRVAGRESMWIHLMERTPIPANETFAPVYYGGGSTAGLAMLIPLRPGQEFRADFRLPLLPARRIRGVVKNLIPYKPAQIELLRGEDDASATRVSLNIATGKFEVQEVVDGTYQIRVTQDDGKRRLRAIETVQVAGGDVDGVAPALSPGSPLRGVVRVEGPKQREVNSRVGLEPLDERPLSGARRFDLTAVIGPEGRFQFDEVPPGRYRFRLPVYQMYVASARLGDQDLLATPEFTMGVTPPGEFEIVVRTDGGVVAARVEDQTGLTGILVPESGERRPMISSVYEGSFGFDGVPPGVYCLSVWKNGADIEYLDPGVLQMLRRRGERVEVLPGQTARVEIPRVLEPPE